MMIDEQGDGDGPEEMEGEKEIKVKIPLDYHIKLHTVKVVEGQNISDTVRMALTEYFQDLKEEQESSSESEEAQAPGN
jgi:hypothetical protein